jgi:monoamine oxidase
MRFGEGNMSLFATLDRRFGKKRDAISRRESLRATLAASSGLLLSDCCAGDRRRQTRVVIVGAGFAGLAAAHELNSVGYDVTVVEARKRLGGRVLSFSDFIPNRNIEGGGELIGSNHPTWVNYKEKFKLEFLDVSDSEDEAPVFLEGRRLTADESEKLWNEMDEALKLMNDDARKIDAVEPWNSADSVKLDRRPTAAWLDSLDVSPLCKLGVDVQLSSNNGVRTAWQSYLGNLTQVKGGGVEHYWTDSEVYRCKGGNQLLATKLAEAVGSSRILLGTPVDSISTTEKLLTVTLAGGKKLEADDVVLAVPASVWKRIAITPPLPGQLVPQMGSNVKFLTSLKGRFWKDSSLSPWGLSDGIAAMTWDATDGQDGDDAAGMSVYAGGPAAETGRQLQPEERNEKYLSELAQLFPDIRQSFVKARFMDWPSEFWTGCGFSFPAPGQITTMGPILCEGLGNLHFAGEHTCYAFVGYMEGALNSGVSLAKRLASRDGLI